MPREPAFAVLSRHRAGETYESPLFVCPKCGSEKTNRTWERHLDVLNCSCGECGYQQIREPLDAAEEEEEDG